MQKSIKLSDAEVTGLKARFDALRGKLSGLRSSGKAAEMKQKQQEINQISNELITVKTRQEQFQILIENSLNRKDDLTRKIAAILEEQALQPIAAKNE